VRREGQSALFDAFAFLAIMLLASSLVLVYAGAAFDAQEVAAREAGIAYAEDTLTALLRITVDDAAYVNATGAVVALPNGTPVERLLLDELALRVDGVSEASFASLEAAIYARARALVRASFRFAVVVQHEGDGVALQGFAIADGWRFGEARPPSYFAASWTYAMPGDRPGEARIALWLWR
jgi:hypothetical protein